ncbi:dTDP-glucose 4,6-dehydratase [Streptomyces sp. NPDC051133]|uniref:dTDP-glucose 4,6-dehydratase n=1 Tax=Streptomyces sp. NPDC051133 TaxID=3155521 RepID=UPI0034420B63
MKILVTGGAGFIGSNFVRRLLEGAYEELAGASVAVLDKFTYAGRIENLEPVLDNPLLSIIHGDICDAPTVRQAISGSDLVVHFAAESHVDRSIASASAFVDTNVRGTYLLLAAALEYKVGRFIHVSTDEVYGSINHGAFTESSPLRPNSPYAASKTSSDLFALAFHRTHGLPVCVTRCSNNYGPYQFPEKAIPRFITAILSGSDIPLYGDGLHRRDWLHVDDHCRGLALVSTRGRDGHVYNIGGGKELANIDLARRVLKLLGADTSRIDWIADRKAHDRRYCVDISKISDDLGYAPHVSFDEGLEDTVRWYSEHPQWWQSLTLS